MTFEKVRREVSFEILIPPWLARSAKWPQKRSGLGRRGGGVSGRRKEWWWWVEGGVEGGVCVCGWCGVGRREGARRARLWGFVWRNAAGQTECRLKSEFLLYKPSQKSTSQQKYETEKEEQLKINKNETTIYQQKKKTISSLSLRLLLCLRCSIQF